MSTVLTEQGADGADCSLSPGDVVTRLDDNPDADQKVKVLVSSSQKSDCHSGSQLSMAVDDLQEMHNHFREQLDSGLKTLAENQGKNGIPAGPAPGGPRILTDKCSPIWTWKPNSTISRKTPTQPNPKCSSRRVRARAATKTVIERGAGLPSVRPSRSTP